MASRQKHDSEEERLVRSIDDLAEFQAFKEALLPKLRQMVLEGWSADKIRREVGHYIAARVASQALLGPMKSATTLKAAQDTGADSIKTFNATNNHPVLRMNEKFGFIREPTEVTVQKRFDQ